MHERVLEMEDGAGVTVLAIQKRFDESSLRRYRRPSELIEEQFDNLTHAEFLGMSSCKETAMDIDLIQHIFLNPTVEGHHINLGGRGPGHPGLAPETHQMFHRVVVHDSLCHIRVHWRGICVSNGRKWVRLIASEFGGKEHKGWTGLIGVALGRLEDWKLDTFYSVVFGCLFLGDPEDHT